MYRWVDHTGEVELQIEAGTESEVFSEALAALAELLDGGAQGEPARRPVHARAPDRPALLAAWLEELLYLADADGFVPERVAALELGEASLDASVDGKVGSPSPLVKAVTYHRLELEHGAGAWRARVVLDV